MAEGILYEREQFGGGTGVGAQVQPEYPGADKNSVGPLVDVSVARQGEQFEFGAPDDNFDISLYSHEGLSVGPVANFEAGRKNRDFGERVGKVPSTFELGGFVQYQLSEFLRLRAEVRKGVGGHNGLIASLGADAVWRDGDRRKRVLVKIIGE